jgi:FkbM family methyltransferase
MKKKFPKATIICIEPDPENFRILQKNVASYENIHCECCGIWNKDTTLKVYDKFGLGEFGKWGMVVEEDLKYGNIKVLSMNTLLKKYAIEHIDILKIDIETSEKQLFQENFEHWLPLVKTIIIELHDNSENGCASSFFGAIVKTYSSYNFSILGESVVIQNMNY